MRDYLTIDHQLLGTAGTYFVMSELAARGFHAACTFGNAPYIDILVSRADGARSVAIQVKSAESAKRMTGKRGATKTLTRLEWFLGKKAAKANLDDLFIIFVDFDKWSVNSETDCYIVPSRFVYDYCKDWVESAKMVRLHISPELLAPYKRKWSLITEALETA